MKNMYVAYGSNLNLEQMAFRCPTAKVYGCGMIKNHKLVFNRVASIEPSDGMSVPVAVWLIDDNCEAALDIYEGYPHAYRKEMIDVEMFDGKTIQGMVYIMNSNKRSLPSHSYYKTIEQGYEDVGLDKEYLVNALMEAN